MTNLRFDYQTVDIPVFDGRLQFDVVCNLMGQKGWRPLIMISPNAAYPHNSIVFEKEVTND